MTPKITPARALWAQFWYDALHANFGIFIKTPDAAKLKTQLYTTRRHLQDPALAQITIRTSPRDIHGEVWLIKLPNQEQQS